jgi:hypothetical protein
MTTLCRRAFVSIATITITLALGACVGSPSRSMNRPISTEALPLTFRFDNLGRESVDVYLIDTKREWMLGRVAPGATATLKLPDEAFAEGSMRVRLAVIAGEHLTFAAARNPRALLTVEQSGATFLSQRWTFSQGSLTPLPLGQQRF